MSEARTLRNAAAVADKQHDYVYLTPTEARELADVLENTQKWWKLQVRGLQCDECTTRTDCGLTLRPLCNLRGAGR